MQALLTSILARSPTRGFGGGRISTARGYKSHLEGFFSHGGLRPTEVFGSGHNADDLQKRLAEMDGKLVYHDDAMRVTKATKASSELSPNSIMDFECVITSKSVDRDGDILEPNGALPDPAMPFLWQHNAALPVGKLLSITDQSASRLAGKFAIYDVLNGLGKDTAFLIENNALRISHGFVPEPGEYEPLAGKDGGGFHVRKFKVLETSGVSVPSNPDAVIVAYSRGKLCNPLVKGWAKEFFDARPVVVAGYSLREKKGQYEREIKVATHEELKEHLGEESELQSSKSEKSMTIRNKGFCVELEGSWGDIQAKLQNSLLPYLLAGGVRVDSDQTAYICEMFDDRAVVCVYDYYSGDWTLYSCPWTEVNGEPQWAGQPAEVQVTGQLQERMGKVLVKNKRTGLFQLKVGRALSASTETSLRDAVELIEEVADRADVPKPAKTQLNSALSLLADVLSQVDEADEDDDDGQSGASDYDAGKRFTGRLAKMLGDIFEHGDDYIAECERFLMSAAGAVAASKAKLDLAAKSEENSLYERILNGYESLN